MMRTPALATVYLDNDVVGLMGDPKPLVSKILAAGGKTPGPVQAVRARTPDDTHGKPLRLEDTIDRTAEPAKPVYLRSVPKVVAPAAARNAAVPRSRGVATEPPEWSAWPGTAGPGPRPLGPLPSRPGTPPEPGLDGARPTRPASPGEAERQP